MNPQYIQNTPRNEGTGGYKMPTILFSPVEGGKTTIEGMSNMVGILLSKYDLAIHPQEKVALADALLQHTESSLASKGKYDAGYQKIIKDLREIWEQANLNTTNRRTLHLAARKASSIVRTLRLIIYREKLATLREDMLTQAFPEVSGEVDKGDEIFLRR